MDEEGWEMSRQTASDRQTAVSADAGSGQAASPVTHPRSLLHAESASLLIKISPCTAEFLPLRAGAITTAHQHAQPLLFVALSSQSPVGPNKPAHAPGLSSVRSKNSAKLDTIRQWPPRMRRLHEMLAKIKTGAPKWPAGQRPAPAAPRDLACNAG